MQQLLQIALEPVSNRLDGIERNIEKRFDGVEQNLQFIGKLSRRSDRDIDNILGILVRIENKFDDLHKNHEHRIKRLEKKAGLAQIGA